MTFDEWWKDKKHNLDNQAMCERSWNAALSEAEKIIKERIEEIEKDIENPIYCIDHLIGARDESKSILSAIRKLKEE